MSARKVTVAEIEAAAKMLCFMNGIPECMSCTPETCLHGMRDFGEEARAALEAAAIAVADVSSSTPYRDAVDDVNGIKRSR